MVPSSTENIDEVYRTNFLQNQWRNFTSEQREVEVERIAKEIVRHIKENKLYIAEYIEVLVKSWVKAYGEYSVEIFKSVVDKMWNLMFAGNENQSSTPLEN